MVEVQVCTKRNNRENARRRYFRNVNGACLCEKNGLPLPFFLYFTIFSQIKKRHILHLEWVNTVKERKRKSRILKIF